ncbi:MAG: carbohydrate-binding family 9-like protein [Prolixibacteraceae bacterium]
MAFPGTEKLLIPFIGDPFLEVNMQVAIQVKSRGTLAVIDKINWVDYPYCPGVELFIGYSITHLWLCYEVSNDHFRVKAVNDQDAVWEDSCVEFFMTSENNPKEAETSYRNFEFNPRGICLSAFGSKQKREFLSPVEMQQIRRFPGKEMIGLKEGDPFDWQLTVAVPLTILHLVPGSTFRANFYKCGDLTLKPHFLSWNRIDSAEPDFHLPDFFGEAQLII